MISKILNVGLGALASTALYTALSHTAYDPHNLSILTNLGILAKTLGFFSATYVGLGVAQTVTKTVVKTLKETADFCARKLGEFQGLRIQN